MSVINQVLNQLEQRGAHTVLDRTTVRAVPHSQRKLAANMPLLAFGVVLGVALAAGVVAWQWMQARKQVVAAGAIQRQPKVMETPVVSAVPAAAVAIASAPIASEVPLVEMFPPVSSSPVSSSPVLPQPVSSSPVSSTPASSSPVSSTPASSSPVSSTPASSSPVSSTPASPSPVSPQPASPQPASPTLVELNSISPPPSIDRPAKAVPPVRIAKPRPAQSASPNRAAVQPPADVSPMKLVSPAQHVDAEFNKAVTSMQQGHIDDAIEGYETVLRLDAGHDAARQALVALLLESKRGVHAERVLRDGLKNKPEHTAFAMLLARLQVEHVAVDQAVVTLEKSLPYANSQADYQAFYAALLQRQNRHKEAIAHYQIALQITPDNGIWLMGYGISLQALQRNEDARDAFRRALESNTLNPELQAFVQQKLRGL